MLAMSAPARAQSDPDHEGSVWLGYMSEWQLPSRWDLFFDSHFVPETFFVLRGGLTYRWETGPSITGGYARLWTDPGDGSLTRDEHRPWAQIFLPFRFSDTWSVSQRIRYDLRVRERVRNGEATDEWMVQQRLRFQTSATYWLAERPRGRGLVQLADEVLLNFGNEAGPNFLDQNRLSLMVGWVWKTWTFRVGYMDRFVPGPTGVNPYHQHLAVFWVNHVIRLGVFREDPSPPPMPEDTNP